MRIAFASSECVPFVKTGGLADVAGSLPKALMEAGCEVKVFLPLYNSIDVKKHKLIFASELADIPIQIGEKTVTFNVWYGRLSGSAAEIYLIDCPLYYHRGSVYTNDLDEDERFILFQHAVLHILQRFNWAPDVLHCNDWQTGLLPAYLKLSYSWDTLFKETACLFSIHNIGYQGRFPRDTVSKAGLSFDHYYPTGPLEFNDSFSFLKTGIVYSEIISTVSETYALEIQTPAYGAGMEKVLAGRKADLAGILNGIDTQDWNPRTDALIPFHFSAARPGNKKMNKQALLKQVNLPFDNEVPVIGIVSRLTKQKGMELLLPVIHEVMKLPVQFVALGSGDPQLEAFFRWAAATYPTRFASYIGFNNELAHLITAGADMFLMPSLYEPCGLNQMYSLNYGTVPIVRKTGGLNDTVKDFHDFQQLGNGFSFNDPTPYALLTTISRALTIFKIKGSWKAIMKRGMTQDFSWQASAGRYLELYKQARIRHQAIK